MGFASRPVLASMQFKLSLYQRPALLNKFGSGLAALDNKIIEERSRH